ncbi:MAG: CHAT domain-containing protein [Chloroflexota bacterium]
MPTEIKATFTIRVKKLAQGYSIEATGTTGNIVAPSALKGELSVYDKNMMDIFKTKPYEVNLEQLTSLGQSLFKLLFSQEIYSAYWQCHRDQKDGGVRLRLIIEPPELAYLPWELLHDGEEFLAFQSEYPLVRGIRQEFDSKKSSISGRLKILYVWAEPQNLPALNLDQPAQSISELLKKNKKITFDILPNATIKSLRSALLNDYHILCFAGHGTANHIYFEDGSSCETLSAKELGRELEGKATRLVFLAACRTAENHPDTSTNFAQTLAIQTRLPAVMGMQFEISDLEANDLAVRFFETLSAMHPVDSALAEARKSIASEQSIPRDIFAPVLYLQSQSSALFRRAINWWAIIYGMMALIAATAIILQALFYAPDRRQIAQAQSTAQSESFARQTAQANEIIRAEEAKQQSNIALARNLANLTGQIKDKQLSILLVIESLQRSITTEGSDAAMSLLSASSQAIAEVKFDDGNSPISFLPDFPPNSQSSYSKIADMLHYDNVLNWVTKPIITRSDISGVYKVKVYKWQPSKWQVINMVSRTVTLASDSQGASRIYDTLQFSSNGRWCVYYDKNDLVLWDTISDKDVIKNASPTLKVARFSTDSSILMTITVNGQIRYWDTNSGNQIYSTQIDGSVQDAEFSSNGEEIALRIGKQKPFESDLFIFKRGTTTPMLELHGAELAGFSQDGKFAIILPYIGDVEKNDYERFDINIYKVGENQPIKSLFDDRFISFNPATNQILTLSQNRKTLRLIDLSTGNIIAQFAHPESCSGLGGLGFSNDGKLLATSCWEGVVYIWGTELGEIINTLNLTYAPDTLNFSSDNKLLVTANLSALPVTSIHSTQVSIWNVQSGTPVGQIIQGELIEKTGIPSNLATSILFDPQNNWLATTDTNNVLRILDFSRNWSKKVAELVHDNPGSPGSVQSAWSYALPIFSPTDPIIAVSGGNGDIEIWDFLKNQILFQQKSYDMNVTKEMKFSPDGEWVAMAGLFCQGGGDCPANVRLFNARTGLAVQIDDRAKTWIANVGPAESHIQFSPDSQYLAIGWEDGLLHVFKTNNWSRPVISKSLAGNIRHLVFSSDHKLMTLGLKDGSIIILLPDQNFEEMLRFEEPNLTSLAISPDGSFIGSGNKDGDITVWDAKTGKKLSVQKLSDSISFIAFNQDSTRIAATDNFTLAVWAPVDGKLLMVVQKPERFGQYEYSKDGHWAFTGVKDQFLVLDTNSGKEIMRFPAGSLPGLSLDSQFYTSQTDISGTIAVWRWRPSDLITTACQRVSRNLSPNEWSTYFGGEPYHETCKK